MASPKEGTNNQTAKFQTVIPESPVNGNTTKHHSEIASQPEESPNDDAVNVAALGCPNNPPNLHGPPTVRNQKEMDKDMDSNDRLEKGEDKKAIGLGYI